MRGCIQLQHAFYMLFHIYIYIIIIIEYYSCRAWLHIYINENAIMPFGYLGAGSTVPTVSTPPWKCFAKMQGKEGKRHGIWRYIRVRSACQNVQIPNSHENRNVQARQTYELIPKGLVTEKRNFHDIDPHTFLQSLSGVYDIYRDCISGEISAA